MAAENRLKFSSLRRITDIAGLLAMCKMLDIPVARNPTSYVIGSRQVYCFHVHPETAITQIKIAMCEEYNSRQVHREVLDRALEHAKKLDMRA